MTQVQTTQSSMYIEWADQMLRELLESLTIAEMRKIGRRRGFTVKGTRKADIMDQLLVQLANVSAPDFLAGLTREEHDLLRAANTALGMRRSVTWEEVQWAWNQCEAGGRAQAGRSKGPKVLRPAFEGLQEYGLLYRCRLHGGGEHYHWLPHLLGVRLPVVKLQVKAYPRRKVRGLLSPGDTPSAPAALALLVAFAAQHSLHLRKRRPRHRQAGYFHWLGDWDHDPDEVQRILESRRGFPWPEPGAVLTVPPPQPLLADNVLDRFNQWLGQRRGAADPKGSEREYAGWLVLLAIAAGILTKPEEAKTSLAVQPAQWRAWQSWPPEVQLRTLFDIWRQSIIGLTELAVAQHRKPGLRLQRTLVHPQAFTQQDFTPQDLAQELALARGFATRLLQELSANTWHDWFSFAEAARQIDPEFLHNNHGPEAWGFVVRGKKRLDPSRRGDWDRGYRPILAAILEGPLRWFGIVEVGYRGGRPLAFRLTETGAWLLRGEGRPGPLLPGEADEAPVTWLDDSTFRALPGPETASTLALAGSLAQPTRRAFVYELSDEGIQQAFARGIDPAAIAGTFEKAGAPLPAAASQRIEGLWSHFGYIHLYEKLTVLELADDLALRELLANTNLRQHLIHQFSPRVVVVEDSAVDALVEELIKKGYTPKVTSDQ
ncbi:MAG: helicase-associated domain-containing protein [Anaerolineae bacterium]